MTSHESRKVAHIHRDLHSHLPSDSALRVRALESLLVEKGLLDSATVDAYVDFYVEKVGPKRGAQVVARAWRDPAFKDRLLTDGTAAVNELGFDGPAHAHLRVVENTADTHNLVVCTLCSCYPHSILGIPPNWYKSAEYRTRAVRDPRGVLAEFGVSLDDDTAVRVWDSTSEVRFMVLPQRPAGTDDLDEDALAALVTRNAMVGTDRLTASAG